MGSGREACCTKHPVFPGLLVPEHKWITPGVHSVQRWIRKKGVGGNFGPVQRVCTHRMADALLGMTLLGSNGVIAGIKGMITALSMEHTPCCYTHVLLLRGSFWNHLAGIFKVHEVASSDLVPSRAATAMLGVAPVAQIEDVVHAILIEAVSYTHLRAHETRHDIVCRL